MPAILSVTDVVGAVVVVLVLLPACAVELGAPALAGDVILALLAIEVAGKLLPSRCWQSFVVSCIGLVFVHGSSVLVAV